MCCYFPVSSLYCFRAIFVFVSLFVNHELLANLVYLNITNTVIIIIIIVIVARDSTFFLTAYGKIINFNIPEDTNCARGKI